MHPFIAAHYDKLSKCYTEPHRYYHNLDHISSMLSHMSWAFKQDDKFWSENVVWYDELELAVWYHDAVYLPAVQMVSPRFNEEASAKLFLAHIKLLGSSSISAGLERTNIIHAIHATAEHTETKATISPLECMLLDLDLADLGADEMTYTRNTDKVCAEYHRGIPELQSAVLQGNAEFQQKLLGRDHIYYTDLFRNRFEEQARRNIKNRIDWVLGEQA